MGIDHKDFMHGAALIAIADSVHFTALNKASVKYGHYIINHDRHVFLKYNDGSGPGDYYFTFNSSDKQRFRDATKQGKSFAVLVCGDEVVTGLTQDELAALVDLTGSTAEGVKVSALAGRQIRVRGPRGEVGPLPRNSFPARILT